MFAKALSGWTLTTFSIVFQVRKGSCSAKRQAHSELLNLQTSGELHFIRHTCNVQHAQGAPCMQKKKMHSFQKPFKEAEGRKKKQSYMHFTHWVNKLLNLPPLIQFWGDALSPFRGVADSEVASHPSGGTCTSPKPRPCPGDFPSPPALDLRPGFSAAEPSPLCPLLVCGHSPARASPPVAAGWAWGMQGTGTQGLGKPRSEGWVPGKVDWALALGDSTGQHLPARWTHHPWVGCSLGHPKYICPDKRAKGKGKNIPLVLALK